LEPQPLPHPRLVSWERSNPRPAFKREARTRHCSTAASRSHFSLACTRWNRNRSAAATRRGTCRGPPHSFPPRLRFRHGELPRASLSPRAISIANGGL
jgi:hypothetical protein